MEYKYPHLFSPIKVGRLTLKNRIEAAPVNISNLPISGYPTAENIAIFEGKAKGGAAIVHMGECRIDMKTGTSSASRWTTRRCSPISTRRRTR